jgi:hypothetical protein
MPHQTRSGTAQVHCRQMTSTGFGAAETLFSIVALPAMGIVNPQQVHFPRERNSRSASIFRCTLERQMCACAQSHKATRRAAYSCDCPPANRAIINDPSMIAP